MNQQKLKLVLKENQLYVETNGIEGTLADLICADLRDANLQCADIRGANLQGANLQGANLQGSDLRGANIDFSCWPLWCGSKNVNIDEFQARQLMSHVLNVAIKFWPGGLTTDQKAWLNEFHRIKSGCFDNF